MPAARRSAGGRHRTARAPGGSAPRPARLLFNEYGLDTSETGVRTKRLVDHAAQQLNDQGRDSEQTRRVVIAELEQLGFGVDSKGLTQYLLFVGREAIDHLAHYCDQNWDSLHAKAAERAAPAPDENKPAKTKSAKPAKVKPDKTAISEAKRILDASRAADIALFGRMIADNKDFSVHAASQVAHAISTHAVVNEFDFYTAVDDLKPDSESGADMIGTVDFNSACYYRYANVDLDALTDNLDGDTDLADRATRAWLSAFINAVPSGKQNSTAARTMPDTLLGVVRDHGAWNLANAFLKPVTGADLMETSTTRLTEHFTHLRTFYGATQIRAVAAATVSGELTHLDPTEIVTTVDDFTRRLLTTAKV